MKEDLTVDDILNSRPSLRDRAKEAHEQQEADKKRDFEDLGREVTDAALYFCRNDLGLSHSELEDAELDVKPRNPTTPYVYMRVDGVHLRFWFDRAGTEDQVLKIEVQKRKPPMAWGIVKTLADIGQHL